jgi:hypothetical protein
MHIVYVESCYNSLCQVRQPPRGELVDRLRRSHCCLAIYVRWAVAILRVAWGEATERLVRDIS